MKKPTYSEDWHPTWKTSYRYDLLEIYGDTSSKGYAYAYANRRKHTLELIQKVAQPGAKILDVAAAQGNFSLSMAERGFEVTWNDLREDLIPYTRLKYEHGVIHYVPGNIFELNFVECFDVVLITEIIEHVAQPDVFLQKISRLVKLNGHIIMTTPNGAYFRNPLPKFSDCPDPTQFEGVQFQPDSDGHIFELHIDEVETIARNLGLKIIEARFFTNPLTTGHMKSEFLLKLIPHRCVELVEKFTVSGPLPLRKMMHAGMAILFRREV